MLSYVDVLKGKAEVGRRVAVIGAGGIGFDVSEYLLGEKALETPPEKRLDDVSTFLKVIVTSEWEFLILTPKKEGPLSSCSKRPPSRSRTQVDDSHKYYVLVLLPIDSDS